MLCLLLTLLSGISADERCDVSSEFSCSESRDRTSCETDCFQKFGKCRKTVEVKPFLCYEQCCPKTSKRCTPYLEFSNVTEFFANIPGEKKLGELFKKNDVRGLIKMASRCSGAENYDAYNAFFYNADSQSGIFSDNFDSNYIQYFLTRFYYYLDLVFIEKSVICSGDRLLCAKTSKPVDLLCPPARFADLTFGSETNALRIFNLIISDTVITNVVCEFLRILIEQIRHASSECTKNNSALCGFNTFNVYVTVLKEYLIRTKQIAEANFQIKYNFVNSELPLLFVYLPYTSGTFKGVEIITVDPKVYSNNYLIAKFLK